VRRFSLVDLMLLTTVALWGLNFTVTKYIVTHGLEPLSYASIRFTAAGAFFVAFTYARERSLRVRRASVPMLLFCAAVGIVLNQTASIYGLRFTTASTFALVLGTMPIFAAGISWALGIETMPSSFWLAALMSLGGVGLIALSHGSSFSADTKGVLLALLTSFSWSAYSVAVAGLMRQYSPFRISAIVLALGWVGLVAVGARQLAAQSFHLGTLVWFGFAYTVIGPLIVTNILWFKAVDRVGAARATLFGNLQPFFGALFGLLLLGERLTVWEVVGGLAIAAGIVLERRAHEARTSVPPTE
jgi:drug/metabolite transporter (DMT)-like permease